jgi:hypothetical protein
VTKKIKIHVEFQLSRNPEDRLEEPLCDLKDLLVPAISTLEIPGDNASIFM